MATKSKAYLVVDYKVKKEGVVALLPCIDPESITMKQLGTLSKVLPSGRNPKRKTIQGVIGGTMLVTNGKIVCASNQVVQEALKLGVRFLPKRYEFWIVTQK